MDTYIYIYIYITSINISLLTINIAIYIHIYTQYITISKSGWWLSLLYPSEEYDFVSHHPNWLENQKSCSKPPTSITIISYRIPNNHQNISKYSKLLEVSWGQCRSGRIFDFFLALKVTHWLNDTKITQFLNPQAPRWRPTQRPESQVFDGPMGVLPKGPRGL